MVKIIMHGCCGHMGQVISDLVAKDANAEIVAGIDVTDKGNTTYPVFTNIKECQTEADVLIDFSSLRSLYHALSLCFIQSCRISRENHRLPLLFLSLIPLLISVFSIANEHCQ